MSKADAAPIRVFCRVRHVLDDSCVVVGVENDGQTVTVSSSGTEDPQRFVFDHSFACNCDQMEVYELVAKPVVEGECYTSDTQAHRYIKRIQWDNIRVRANRERKDSHDGGIYFSAHAHPLKGNADVEEYRGIIPRCLEDILEGAAMFENTQSIVRISLVEIYNEKIRDLFDRFIP